RRRSRLDGRAGAGTARFHRLDAGPPGDPARRPGGAVRPDHAGAGPLLQGRRRQPGHGLDPPARRGGLNAMTHAYLADDPPPPPRRRRINWPVVGAVAVLAAVLAATFLRPASVSERQREDKTVRVVLPPPPPPPPPPEVVQEKQPEPTPTPMDQPVEAAP